MAIGFLKRLFKGTGVSFDIQGKSESAFAHTENMESLAHGFFVKDDTDYGYIFVVDVVSGSNPEAGKVAKYAADWLLAAFTSDPERWMQKGATALVTGLNDTIRRAYPGALCKVAAVVMNNHKADVAIVGNVQVYHLPSEGEFVQIHPINGTPPVLLGTTQPTVRDETISLDAGDRILVASDGVSKPVGEGRLLNLARNVELARFIEKAFAEAKSDEAVREDRTAALASFLMKSSPKELPAQATEITKAPNGNGNNGNGNGNGTGKKNGKTTSLDIFT